MTLNREEIGRVLAMHGQVARVLVAEARGSVPRGVGTSMLVWQDGFSGTIGGGALEWQALGWARDALAVGTARVHRMSLGPALGQCCGGAVTLVIEVLSEAPPNPWHRRIEGSAMAPEPIGSCDFRDGWLYEDEGPEPQAVWIWGAGHVGLSLARVLAPLPDVKVTSVETDAARLPELPAGVAPLVAANMPAAMTHAPGDGIHLIVTYSHDIDLALCHAALERGFAFCGLIGSATKWARFRSRLQALGHSDAQISRITCPIGEPAFGKHPQAIAVGVAGSLLSHLRARTQTGDFGL